MKDKMNRKERRRLQREMAKSLPTMGGEFDPRALQSFPIGKFPIEKRQDKDVIILSPEEKQIAKLYSVFATNVWRMKRQVYDEEGEPKDGMEKIARYLVSLSGALEDAQVKIYDFDGRRYDEGDDVKVISFEDRPDLKKDEYIETLLPTVRWTDKDGRTFVLQKAEVVVGRALQQ